jgi:hypothetical protein
MSQPENRKQKNIGRMQYAILSVDLRLMDSLRTSDLSSDLLAGPSGGIDSSILKVAVASRLSNHRYQPVGPIILRELAVGKGV